MLLNYKLRKIKYWVGMFSDGESTVVIKRQTFAALEKVRDKASNTFGMRLISIYWEVML